MGAWAPPPRNGAPALDTYLDLKFESSTKVKDRPTKLCHADIYYGFPIFNWVLCFEVLLKILSKGAEFKNVAVIN